MGTRMQKIQWNPYTYPKGLIKTNGPLISAYKVIRFLRKLAKKNIAITFNKIQRVGLS